MQASEPKLGWVTYLPHILTLYHLKCTLFLVICFKSHFVWHYPFWLPYGFCLHGIYFFPYFYTICLWIQSVSCRYHIVKSCFFIHYDSFYLMIGLNTWIKFNEIIGMVRFMATILLCFLNVSCFRISIFLLLPSFVLLLSVPFFKKIFIWLRRVFSCSTRDLRCGVWDLWVAACRIFRLQNAGSSSLTRDRTWAPCIGSTES